MENQTISLDNYSNDECLLPVLIQQESTPI